MTSKTSLNLQRIISISAISLISFFSLNTLVQIQNLYQTEIYVKAAFIFYFILLLWLYFIFDLHLKRHHPNPQNYWQAFKTRLSHLSWNGFRHFNNYLILPGLIYWGSVILIGINFNRVRLQNFVVMVSTVCLVIAYSFFKEIFRKGFEPLKDSHFVLLSYVKLYAAWLAYSAALGIVWYYCLAPSFFTVTVFAVSFMLMYQALFQFHQVNMERVLQIFVVAVLISGISAVVYNFWNVNYFSAGLFLTAIYNFCWTLLFHHNNKTLSKEVFAEQVAIFILILVMVFGTTNFKAQIDRCF